MFRYLKFLLIVIGLTSTVGVMAQEVKIDSNGIFEGEFQDIDHEDLEAFHSPRKATLLSTFLPGAGQVYNKKYWKAPVIWAGIAAALFNAQVQQEFLWTAQNDYKALMAGVPNNEATEASLREQKNYYKKMLETSYIALGVIYGLQILDATVDAQLLTFDVSDDLSMDIIPSAIPNKFRPQPQLGLTLCFKIIPRK